MTTMPKRGIEVFVVGASCRCLTAAIECHRQGQDVEVYESVAALKFLSDIISFGANAGLIFYCWGETPRVVAQKLHTFNVDLRAYGFRIHDHDTGEVVFHQKTPPPAADAPIFSFHALSVQHL